MRAGLTVAAVATGTTLLGLVASAPALGADLGSRVTPGFCQPSDVDGVTVVVDFQRLGGGVQAGCVEHPTPGMSGVDALRAAGFDVTGTQQYGDRVVCRIQDEPSDDPCVRMPQADYYWSYWQATNGGAWRYSDQGIATSEVKTGGFEGYSFVDGRSRSAPRVAPARQVAAPSTTTHSTPSTHTTSSQSATHTHHPSSQSAHSPRPSQQTTGSSTSSTSTAPSPTSSTEESTSATTTTRSSSTTSSATTATRTRRAEQSVDGPRRHRRHESPTTSATTRQDASGPKVTAVDQANQVTGDDDDGGASTTTLAGIGLVGVLAVGAGVAAWRRKHS